MKAQQVDQNLAQSLAEEMVKAGLITPSQLAVARVSQKNLGEDLGKILVQKGFISEEQLLTFIAKSLSIPYVSLKDIHLDPNLLKSVPAHLMHRYHSVPLRQENGKVLMAMSNPLDSEALEDLKAALHMEIQPVLSSSADIEAACRQSSGGGQVTKQKRLDLVEAVDFASPDARGFSASGDGENLERMAAGPSVIMVVNEIIAAAFEEKASDIHLEPTSQGVRVRYRIDGFLEERQRLPRSMLLPVVSRLKILGKMDIAERRTPQDGRMRLKIGGVSVDLRMSTYPTLYGEKVVLRLLLKDAIIGIESLGFNAKDRKTFTDLVTRSHGIFLVTGPTGSGKSTTLYAALSWINSPEKNIISIEDPVESEIGGVSQAQINLKAGLTFASALKSILRQDPDVIMIGEVRDGETAEMAVRAAITGHLVLSTLHTNTASGVVSRLLDLGVEPFLISSALIGVLAQRLVRKICVHCRRPSKEDPDKLGVHAPLLRNAFRGEGCAQCRMSGYSGRIGIFELAPVRDQVLKLINERASDGVIEQELRRQGVRAMIEDGMDKVNEGITTIDEVLRVTQED